ncbi:MAG: hypothetical protein IH924_10645 [Proteobacteria bacterium]|nr:hypothetical protein [Pseudomonadota bacterium]
MTKKEAIELLDNAPQGAEKSAINPGLTQLQAVGIIRTAVECMVDEGDIREQIAFRVKQVCANRKHPGGERMP